MKVHGGAPLASDRAETAAPVATTRSPTQGAGGKEIKVYGGAPPASDRAETAAPVATTRGPRYGAGGSKK